MNRFVSLAAFVRLLFFRALCDNTNKTSRCIKTATTQKIVMPRTVAAAVAASLLLGLFPGGVIITAANYAFVVREDDVNYRIVSPDPSERPNASHLLRFTDSAIGTSVYRFDAELRAQFIMAGEEVYVMRYRDDGSLRKVIRKEDRTDSRMLLTSGEDDEGEEDENSHYRL